MIKKILDDSFNIFERTVFYRRYLHHNAECGFSLEKTNKFISEKLNEIGIAHKRCGKAGITATIGESNGNTVLLRADTDALPIKEMTGLPFAAQRNMHACGHDMHTAMLLAGAQIIKKNEDFLKKGVKLLFQPAEESMLGAKDCIDSNILSSPDVKSAFMLHVLTGSSLPPKSIIVSSAGISAPGAVFFRITVIGKSSHGASPTEGINAISISSHIIQCLNELISSEIPQSDPSALSIGKIRGGDAPNIIADKVIIEGSLRSYNTETILYIKERIKEVSSTIAKVYNANAKVNFLSEVPPLKNDAEMSQTMFNALSKELKNVIYSNELNTSKGKSINGSEDFSLFSSYVPTLMIAISAGEKERGYIHPLHHPKCDFDETILPIGAAAYAVNGFI